MMLRRVGVRLAVPHRRWLSTQTAAHMAATSHAASTMEHEVGCGRPGAAYPSIETARLMPRELYELSNEALVLAARSPDAHDAHQERLIREIMGVDGVEYPVACEKMKEMFLFNAATSQHLLLPMHLGLWTCGGAAIVAFPLVFDPAVAPGFAEFIGAEYEHALPPHPTIAAVGEWSWAWMEPLIGTASFIILCLQLGRSAALNLAMSPYLEYVQSYRANTLANAYPKYSRCIVKDFGRSQPFRGSKFNPAQKSWW